MKKVIGLCIVIVLIISFSSCRKIEDYLSADFPIDLKVQQIILFENDTHTFNIDEMMNKANIKKYKYEIKHASSYGVDKVKIKKDTITPLDNAIVNLQLIIYDHDNKLRYSFIFAKIVSVIESTLIEVRTADDLKQMAIVKHGNYILKNDIDLSDINYEPIGSYPAGNEFTGMFINLDGYKIKNLTITSANNLLPGPYGGMLGGLFGSIQSSFIYGLHLENVNIDISDYEGKGFAYAGAIAANMSGTIAVNNTATGTIKGRGLTGGLYGITQGSIIYNNNFEGVVIGEKKEGYDENFIGGLLGYSSGTHIENSEFKGNLVGDINAGGIVGYHMGSYINIVNNKFNAFYNNEQIFYQFHTFIEKSSFEQNIEIIH